MTKPISSRTPEGDPNVCPVCGKNSQIEPSTVPTKDAPCPHCGHLLWFTDELVRESGELSRSPSYEALLVNVGEKKFGLISDAMNDRLIEALDLLTKQQKLPPRNKALAWLVGSSDWTCFVCKLENEASRKLFIDWKFRIKSLIRNCIDRIFGLVPSK